MDKLLKCLNPILLFMGFYCFTIDTKKQFYYVVRRIKKKCGVDPSGQVRLRVYNILKYLYI